MKRLFAIYLLLALAFVGCDEDDDCPYVDARLCDPELRDSIENSGTVTDTTTNDTGVVNGTTITYSPQVFEDLERSILLEDFTGFRCVNCLPATQTAASLLNQWGSRLVVVAYHATQQFAAPIADPPEPYSTDFRTPEGESFLSEFSITGLPTGLVNRRDFGTGLTQSAGNWPGLVNDIMAEEPSGFVRFRDVAPNQSANEVSFKVAARMFGEIEGNYSLVVGIYEDNLIEAQKDGEETIYPYTHNHVFRGNVNGQYGQPVFTSSTTFEENSAELFTFNAVLESEWEMENSYLFAYLMSEDNLEVVQCTKHPIIE